MKLILFRFESLALPCGLLGQNEIGEISEGPFEFERSINDPQEFPGQGDDRLSRAPPSFDLFVVALQIRAIALGNQGTLHQSGPTQLGPAFGDPSRVFGFVRVADARHNPKVGG